MAQEKEKVDFEFEVEEREATGKPLVDLEIVDDTPDEDKDPATGKMREPMPELVS